MSDKRIPFPHEPAPYDEGIAKAVKAFASGTANQGQQKIAYDWIVGELGMANELPYYHGGPEAQRAGDFAGGRKYVGLQIRKMLSVDFTTKR